MRAATLWGGPPEGRGGQKETGVCRQTPPDGSAQRTAAPRAFGGGQQAIVDDWTKLSLLPKDPTLINIVVVARGERAMRPCWAVAEPVPFGLEPFGLSLPGRECQEHARGAYSAGKEQTIGEVAIEGGGIGADSPAADLGTEFTLALDSVPGGIPTLLGLWLGQVPRERASCETGQKYPVACLLRQRLKSWAAGGRATRVQVSDHGDRVFGALAGYVRQVIRPSGITVALAADRGLRGGTAIRSQLRARHTKRPAVEGRGTTATTMQLR
ncbi:hypothetical protein PCL_05067 [Purpureocillium lilacinum]|uniref:Uncharacterized protein n=1 Tax=Purpureocillium lilacinum TaxID=33203 RepID=A0A2U3DVU1_PURLI|nr:hypothetical protein PCL_05067 [Purpureocillium lilacinum]